MSNGRGKENAETRILELFGEENGTILQPAMVHGTRTLDSGLALPLWVVGAPLEFLCNLPPFPWIAQNLPLFGSLLVPPSSVEDVSMAAVHSIFNTPGKFRLRHSEIHELANNEATH